MGNEDVYEMNESYINRVTTILKQEMEVVSDNLKHHPWHSPFMCFD